MRGDALARAFVEGAAALGERQLRAYLATVVNYNRYLGASDAEIRQLLQRFDWQRVGLNPQRGIQMAFESAQDRAFAGPFVARVVQDAYEQLRRQNSGVTFGDAWRRMLPTLREWGFKEFELVQLRDALFTPTIPLEFYQEGYRFGAPPSSDPLLRTSVGRALAQRLVGEGDDLALARPYYERARAAGIAQAERERQQARNRAAAEAERESYLQQFREGNLWEKWVALVQGGLRGAQRGIASLLTGLPIEELPPAGTLPGMVSPVARELESMAGFGAGVARGALGFLDPYGWATLGASAGLGAAAAPALARLPAAAQRGVAASVPVAASLPAAYQSLQEGDTGGALGALTFGALLGAPFALRGVRLPERGRSRAPVGALPPAPRALPPPSEPPPFAPRTPPPSEPPPSAPRTSPSEPPPFAPRTPPSEPPPSAPRTPPPTEPPLGGRRVIVQESELYQTPQGTRWGIVYDETTGNYRIVDATRQEVSAQSFPSNRVGSAARDFVEGRLSMQPAQVSITPRLVIPPPPPLEIPREQSYTERVQQVESDLQLLARYQSASQNSRYTQAALTRMAPIVGELREEAQRVLDESLRGMESLLAQAQVDAPESLPPELWQQYEALGARAGDAAEALERVQQLELSMAQLAQSVAPSSSRARGRRRGSAAGETAAPPVGEAVAPSVPAPPVGEAVAPSVPAPPVGEAVAPSVPAPPVGEAVAPSVPAPPVGEAVAPSVPAPPVGEAVARARRRVSASAPNPEIALTLSQIQQLVEAYQDAVAPSFRRQVRADIERKADFVRARFESLSEEQQEQLMQQLPLLHRDYLEQIRRGTLWTEVLGDESGDNRRPVVGAGDAAGGAEQPVAPAGIDTGDVGVQSPRASVSVDAERPAEGGARRARRRDARRESAVDAGGDVEPRSVGDSLPRPVERASVGAGGRSASEAAGEGGGRADTSARLESGLGVLRNYQFTDADRAYFGKASEREKIEATLEAIRVLKELEQSNREPSVEDQAKLARFAGWGAIWRVLDPVQREYASQREALLQLLTPDEYNAARNAALNAHYTTPELIESMWGIAQHLGVESGARILEPAAGVGLMAAFAPVEGRWTLVEKDRITAAILRYLYPEYRVYNTGFEQLEGGKGQYDLVISNVPFGNFGVHDPAYPTYVTRRIHDYFLVKSADMLRSGGIMIVITSRYTLDKQDSAIRQALAKRGMQLLGAYRLPNTTFKDFAATSVVTDLLVFQKQSEPVAKPNYVESRLKAIGAPWYYRSRREAESNRVAINEYFLANPDHVLGNEVLTRGMYRAEEYTVEGAFDVARLRRLAERLPRGVYQAAAVVDEIEHRSAGWLAYEFPNRHYFKGDALYVVELFEQTDAATGETVVAPVEARRDVSSEARVVWRDYITLRDALLAVLEADAKGEPSEALRQRLKQAYAQYIQKHGVLNPPRKRPLWDEDLDAPLVRQLEERDTQGQLVALNPVFEQPVVYKPQAQPKTPYEALVASLALTGKIDWDWMAQALNVSVAELQQQLKDEVILNADGEWELITEFLSGNLGEKLTRYENLHAVDPRYERHLQLLRQAMPDPVPLEMLRVTPSAPWVEDRLKADYFEDMVGYRPQLYRNERGLYEVGNLVKGGRGHLGVFDARVAKQLISAALNDKIDLTVQAEGGGVDPLETERRRELVQQLRDNFKVWLLQRPSSVVARIEEQYLRTLGAQRAVDYTAIAEHLDWASFGMRVAVKLKPHQKRAILRVLRQPATLLHHEVGAGKTYELVASAILAKRMGLARKPVIVVQKSTLGQFVAQARTLFPTARIYYASKESDFAPQNRRKFLAGAALGNWDVVILTHEQFEEIPISSESTLAWLDEQLELERAALAAQEGVRLKDIEQAVERMRKRLLGYLDKLKRKRKFGLDFETIGVDMILVDESHQWKGMPFYTTLQDAQYAPSDRGIDGYLKCEIVRAKGGKIVFASGTPIVNKLAEMYIVIRALNPGIWRSLGIRNFEQWRLTFAEQTAKIEMTLRGERKRVFRLDTYINAQKLAEVYRQVADVFFLEDNAELRELLPTLENERGEATGRYIVYAIPKNPIYNEISRFFQRLQSAPDDPKARGAAVLKSFSYAKRAIVDPRLIELNPDDEFIAVHGLSGEVRALNRVLARAHAEPNLKLRVVARKVAEIYRATAGVKGTQLVFMDRGVPKQDVFNAYNELRKYLMEHGVPKEAIAYIHDAKNDKERAALFERVNRGEIRILIGSTEKMGVGVNVQERLVASHYVDVPWRPADLEQRDGRIRRPGNTNKRVRIYVYINEGNPIEEPFWNIVQRKLGFIRDFFRGRYTGDVLEDLNSEVDYKEVLAALTSSRYAPEYEGVLGRLEQKRRAYYAQAGKAAAHRKQLSELDAQLQALVRDADRMHRVNLLDERLVQSLLQVIPALRQAVQTYPLERLPVRNEGVAPPSFLNESERGAWVAYALLNRYTPSGEIEVGESKASVYMGEYDGLLWLALAHPRIVVMAGARDGKVSTLQSRLVKQLDDAEQLLLEYLQLSRDYQELRKNPPPIDPALEQEVRELEAQLREIEEKIRKEMESGVVEEPTDGDVIPSLFGGLQVLWEKVERALIAKRLGAITVRRQKEPDIRYMLRSPIGIYDVEGNLIGPPGYYETIGGERGKQVAQAFVEAQEQLDREVNQDLRRIELILNALERAYQEHRRAGSRITREQLVDRFIDLVEKPFNDPQRRTVAQSGGALGEALRAHDELTEDWRQRIIQWRRSLGIPTPDDWGITTQGYFRHLFAGDVEVRRVTQDGTEFVGSAPNYVEALALAQQHLQAHPDDPLVVQLRQNLPLDPTLRVSTRQYYRVVGELANRTQLTHAEVMEDLRGVVGQARNKRQVLGFERRRQGYAGWTRDYARVMGVTAAQLARARALTRLKRSVQPHLEEWRKMGLHGIAEHVESHIDALRGVTSKLERDLSRFLQQLPIIGDLVSPTPYLFRGLAHRLTRLQAWLKLEAQIKGIPLVIRPALVNLLDPLRTLFPYVEVRELAWAYVQLLDARVRRDLHRLGVVDLRAGLKMNEGALLVELERGSPSWFRRASMVNRAVAYLIGRRRALEKGLSEEEAHTNGLRWARRVEYDNSLWYCAPVLRSPITRVLLQFKGYQQKAIEDMIWSLRRLPASAFGGGGGRGGGGGGRGAASSDALEPVPRWLARVAKLIAAQLLVGGVKGATGAFVALLGGYLVYAKVKEALKETGMSEKDADYYARAVYFGAPALLSVDLSASTTLWELPYGYTTEQRLVNFLLGPTGGTALSVSNPDLSFAEKAKRVSPAGRWVEVAPQLWEGKERIRIGRDKRTGIVSRQEAVLYALGFQPVGRSLEFERREVMRR